MPQPPRFPFDAATTPDARLAGLENFLTFWLGPPPPGAGVPAAELKALTMPAPLRRLYAFAGRWERPSHQTTDVESIFDQQEHLRPPERLEPTDDGKLIFLDENSGNWTCSTLPDGDDPPVWLEDVFDGSSQGRWALVDESLSRFLVTFALRELLFGSQLYLTDKNLDGWFKALRDQGRTAPFWTGAFAYWEGPFSFHLLEDAPVLVGDLGGDLWFAANDDAGVALLQARQGGVREVGLGRDDSSWSFTFRPDGSADMNMSGRFDARAAAPAGSFRFEAVRDALRAAVTDAMPRANPWYVYFMRFGQSSSQGQGLTDPGLAAGLCRQVLERATTREANVDALLREFPPPF